jgi:hypothetical protein
VIGFAGATIIAFESRVSPPSHCSEHPMTPSILLWFCLGVTAQSPGADKPPSVEKLRPESGWKELGRNNLWFDPKGMRVILRARVVLREGPLEHLMCLKGTKEHEAIVATDAAPKVIHTALLLTGAEPGHPVEFVPMFKPPAGTAIAIEFLWHQDGELKKADARRWVWDDKAKAPLETDWVFAGSFLFDDRVTKKKTYAAEEGDLITVANFATAILDLPISSSANDADRGFSTNTAKIPPVGTEVFVILTPRQPKPTAKSGKGANRGP